MYKCYNVFHNFNQICRRFFRHDISPEDALSLSKTRLEIKDYACFYFGYCFCSYKVFGFGIQPVTVI